MVSSTSLRHAQSGPCFFFAFINGSAECMEGGDISPRYSLITADSKRIAPLIRNTGTLSGDEISINHCGLSKKSILVRLKGIFFSNRVMMERCTKEHRLKLINSIFCIILFFFARWKTIYRGSLL